MPIDGRLRSEASVEKPALSRLAQVAAGSANRPAASLVPQVPAR